MYFFLGADFFTIISPTNNPAMHIKEKNQREKPTSILWDKIVDRIRDRKVKIYMRKFLGVGRGTNATRYKIASKRGAVVGGKGY